MMTGDLLSDSLIAILPNLVPFKRFSRVHEGTGVLTYSQLRNLLLRR